MHEALCDNWFIVWSAKNYTRCVLYFRVRLLFFLCVAREREIRMFSLIRTFLCSKKNQWNVEFECLCFHRLSLTKINQTRRGVKWRSQKFFEVKEESWFESECLCRFAFKFLTSVFSLFSVTKFTKLKMLFSGKEEESSKVWCSTAQRM